MTLLHSTAHTGHNIAVHFEIYSGLYQYNKIRVAMIDCEEFLAMAWGHGNTLT